MVSPFCPWPRWKLSSFLGFYRKPTLTRRSEHVDFIKGIGGRGEVYTAETQTTSTGIFFLWKQNKTEQNKTQPSGSQAMERIYYLSAALLSILLDHPSLPPCLPPIALLSRPHPTANPNSLSSMHSTRKPQPPDSVPDPSRCPTEQKDLSSKSNPLLTRQLYWWLLLLLLNM